MEKNETPKGMNGQNDPADVASQENIKNIWEQFKEFVLGLLDIRNGAEPKITIEGIKKDIPFKGHTAWILVFSIFIASIGLNTNSTAVVIGAMLISPLMGPILGIGLSVGINDIETLRRSFVNFLVMVFLSILTAFIYFKFSPFQTASNEILGRVEPTFLDVLIAFSGGLAGIVAGSRKEKSNAIPGVAIATALMPPLCTAGFGLATGNLSYFFGAMYLFIINTIFIALSTFLIVKYLRFPMARYANAARRKKVNRIVISVALLVIIPSVFSFISIMERTFYERDASLFLKETVIFPGSEQIKHNIDFEKKELEVYMIGNNVPVTAIEAWQAKIGDSKRLTGTKLKIRQGHDKTDELTNTLSNKVKEGVLQDLYAQNSKELSNKDAKILLLENELQRVTEMYKKDKVPLLDLAKEAKINYDGLEGLSFAKVVKTNLKKVEEIPVASAIWSKKLKKSVVNEQSKKLRKWLQFKLELDTLLIKQDYY
ncbi:TIGR00341 family protein [Aquimarina agarivorans]|uniref:TIGR00341 family protein n=1 Tax=Aquimarina agarivorans TaxID=980584 RepID=UPI000248EB93|nr:TIGR00341 family protein [Aquimarina agarivorans]